MGRVKAGLRSYDSKTSERNIESDSYVTEVVCVWQLRIDARLLTLSTDLMTEMLKVALQMLGNVILSINVTLFLSATTTHRGGLSSVKLQ